MFSSIILFFFESPTIVVFVVIVALLLFGSAKLPQLAKSLGQSKKAFREGMREAEEEEEADKARLAPANPTPAPAISQMSDEELMAEMRRRVESKQS